MQYDILTILGPTATGKTKLAAFLAGKFNGEIISADSRQVYRKMDIGTGKDLVHYTSMKIKYHLVDIIDPAEEYNLFEFKTDFYEALKKISKRKKLPIMVGGTGLYISSILQNYFLPGVRTTQEEINELNKLSTEELREILIDIKPKLHNITDLKERNRIIQAILVERAHTGRKTSAKSITSLNIGILLEREEIKNRIKFRLSERLESGMIEEVQQILDSGISHEKLEYFGLEYKFISKYLAGKLNYNEMFQQLNNGINKFSKRQMTWFRKMEREGVIINWFDGSDYSAIQNFISDNMRENA